MRRFLIIVFAGSVLFAFAEESSGKQAKVFTLLTDTVKKAALKPDIPYPPLPASVARLFYLQRDPNSNTVVYELNARNGVPDSDEPVHPYWIRYNEHGQKEELGFIQRRFAYSVSAKSTGSNRYDIRLAAYKKFPLTLMKGTDGKYHIFATILQQAVIVNRIFVKIEGGTFWVPNVRYIEIVATEVQTGKELIERFKP